MMPTGRLPPLSSLRTFEAAARHASFTRAAAELNVTPAAVSHQVRALEAHVGVDLFRRIGRSVELTVAGRTLLPGVREGFARLGEAVDRLRAVAEPGVMTVSVAPSFAAKWLVLRLDGFRQRHPEIDVRISATTRVVDFGRDEIDLAVRYGAGRYPGLHVERLLDAEVYPVCSPALLDGANPLREPADLRRHALIHDESAAINDELIDWRMWLAAAGVEGVDATRGLRVNSGFLAVEAAIAGRGVALVNGALAAADLAAGRLVRPFSLSLRDGFAYWIVCPPDRLERAKVRAFRAWLIDEAGANSSGGGAQ